MELQVSNTLYAYRIIRLGMALIAFMLPILVVVVGYIDNHLPVQSSLSAYYWAASSLLSRSRDVFVGGLTTLSAFLFLYKGFSDKENRALNLAGVFGIAVVWFPMGWGCTGGCTDFSPHGTFAVLMFACLAYVVWFRAEDTMQCFTDKAAAKPFRRFYKITGALMLASPLAAFVLNAVLGTSIYTLLAETFGIWSFALFWIVKDRELSISGIL